MHSNIPWQVVRGGIHIGYDYVDNEPTQFDYISNIDTKDLKQLNSHCVLQRHYDADQVEENLDWSDLIKLIAVELEWRQAI